jgi:hypothetical protein
MILQVDIRNLAVQSVERVGTAATWIPHLFFEPAELERMDWMDIFQMLNDQQAYQTLDFPVNLGPGWWDAFPVPNASPIPDSVPVPDASVESGTS